jgi:hypothetical protein
VPRCCLSRSFSDPSGCPPIGPITTTLPALGLRHARPANANFALVVCNAGQSWAVEATMCECFLAPPFVPWPLQICVGRESRTGSDTLGDASSELPCQSGLPAIILCVSMSHPC